MGFRFQRRIPLAPGLRLNLSKTGIGGSLGRTGLRVGIDATGKKYFSLGLPGTGLSYRATFVRPIKPATLKQIAYAVLAAAVFLAALVVLMIRSRS
jgi:Protein of unknown function (DUF4236)